MYEPIISQFLCTVKCIQCLICSLETTPSVTDWVCDDIYANIQRRRERRELVLCKPADHLPLKLVESLEERNVLERNWIGLASKYYLPNYILTTTSPSMYPFQTHILSYCALKITDKTVIPPLLLFLSK